MDILAYLAVAYAAQFYVQAENQMLGKNSKIMAVVIANSVDQFYADHNRLPGRAGPDSRTLTSGGSSLVKILLGKEGQSTLKQNPRNTNYLDGMTKAKTRAKNRPALPGTSPQWINGLIQEGDVYGLVDGWGNYFTVVLDSNFDLKIANPNPFDSARAMLPKRAIIWSPGKDGNPDTWEDNVISWD